MRQHEQMWSGPGGCDVPFVRNAMPPGVFQNHRGFIAWNDYGSPPASKDVEGWGPLQRMRPLIKHADELLPALWTLGPHMSLDESMIKYIGRAIKFIVYITGLLTVGVCDLGNRSV